MHTRRALAVIVTAVALNAAGVGLIFPILPSLMRTLSDSPEVSLRFGAMLSIYAAMQLLFSPVLGALSDRFGRRPVLLLSLAGATLDYVFMALAPALWMLFVGRAIAGVSSATMAVATSAVADITAEEDRARRFGYLQAAFGVGLIVGPVIGGTLGAWWVRAPFALAAVLCLLNLLFALFALPETRPPSAAPSTRSGGLGPMVQLRWALAQRRLRPMLILYLTLNLVGQAYGTSWVIFCEDRFTWDSQLVGVSIAAYGLLHAAAQIGLAGRAAMRLGLPRTVALGMLFEGLACGTVALLTQGWMLFALLPLFALGGISLPALQSLLSGTVDPDHQGRLQGVLSSLVSLTAIVGPLLFSAVYTASRAGWNGWVWVVCAGSYALVWPTLARLPERADAARGRLP